MSAISQVVKALCAFPRIDARGSAIPLDIDPATMRGAFAAVLDGGASDLEMGALMTASASLEAQHAADWFAEVILGLNDAIRDRMTPLIVEADSAPVVVLPNYGDEDAFPALPLVALLLRRNGVRVLVHGAVETHGGLFNCGVFREFGVLPAATRSQAERQIAENGLVLLPATLFSPGLVSMLCLRNRLGIRTPAHALANLLMPVVEASTVALHVLHIAPWLKDYLAKESVVLSIPALIVASESCSAGAGLRDSFEFCAGESAPVWQTLFDSDRIASPAGKLAGASGAFTNRSPDPRAWVDWTRQHLAGKSGLPLFVAKLFASCLYGCGYAGDIHQAKAIVAVESGNQAAA